MSNATRTGHAPTGPAPPSIPDTPTDPSRAVARPRPGRSLPRLRAQPHGPPAAARPRTQREGRGLPRPEDRHGGGADEPGQHDSHASMQIRTLNGANPALHRHPEWRSTLEVGFGLEDGRVGWWR